MSTYTKDSENIYFLNDKNIASSLIDDSVLSNAIPSHELFKDTYDGLSTYDNNLCIEVDGLNTKTNTISLNLCSEVKNLSIALSLDLSNEISSRIKAVQDLSVSLSSDINSLSDRLSAEINSLSTSLSNTADEKFVLKTGDLMETLSVAGKIELSSDIVVPNHNAKITIGNAVAPREGMFVWNSTEDLYYGKETDNGEGNTFNINPSHELCGVFVGEKSLCAYITEDVALTASNIRGEINTVSSLLTGNYALSSDVSAVSKLVNDKGYLISNDFDFKYYSDTRKIQLSAGNKIISIDATDFIKDGMIDTVSVITENRTYPELQITFNTDSGKDTINISLEKLVDIYKSNTDGISVENYKIGLDFNTVAKTENLNQLSASFGTISANHENRLTTTERNIDSINTYVYKLSSVNGIIDTLSDTIDANIRNISTISGNLQTAETDINELKAFKSNLTGDGGSIDIINDNISVLQREIANNATFGEHIEINSADNNKTLAEIFETKGLINPGSNPRTLKNGNMYQVFIQGITNDSPLSTKVQASFTTADGFKFVHNDYIVIHSHDKDYVELNDLLTCVEVIPAVRFDEFNKLSARANTNYFWLSGNNNQEAMWISENGSLVSDHSIGGNNYFKGTNYFEGISANIISSINISVINLTSDSLSASKISAYNMSVDNLSARNISTDWKNVKHSDNGYSLYDLSVDLSNKIFIKNELTSDGKTADLSIIKISKDEYDEQVASTTLLSDNVLYVVEADYIDAYGQVISNLVMTDNNNPSEATNKDYVDVLCVSLSDTVVLSVENLQAQIISNDNDIIYLSGQHDQLSAALSLDLSNEISSRIKAVQDLSDNLSTDLCALSIDVYDILSINISTLSVLSAPSDIAFDTIELNDIRTHLSVLYTATYNLFEKLSNYNVD